MNKIKPLLDHFHLNALLTLKNRILMAPMTRAKADNNLVPTEAMASYYARRADAGLIITEGTVISSTAAGHSQVPGIFDEAQIEGWRQVTEAVHAKQGLIFSQIWHVGRVSHPNFLKGALPLSASETEMKGRLPRSEGLSYGKSRAASLDEIKGLTETYVAAAQNAIKAGFDGIELHGANGYLIDQFLHYDTNKRQDEYGGGPEGMARFALEVVRACGEAIGFERVGLRLSPGAYLNEIVGDERDAAVFKYLLEQLNDLSLAYVHTGNYNDAQKFKELNDLSMTAFIRLHYKGTVVACGSYTVETAQQGLLRGDFDLVSMGRPFIANPDFIQKLVKQEPLQAYVASMLGTLV